MLKDNNKLKSCGSIGKQIENLPIRKKIKMSQVELQRIVGYQNDIAKINEETIRILDTPVNYGIKINFAKAFDRFLLLFSKSEVKTPPASFLLHIAELLPKKQRQSLEQEVSDMRLEYYEALLEKRIWRARFIAGLYYIGLGWSAVIWISDKAKQVIGIIPKVE